MAAAPAVGPFPLAPGEVFKICPYDSSHMVTQHRILYHLQKCRRNYTLAQQARGFEAEYGVCRFDYTHQFPKIEMLFHEAHCSEQLPVLKHMDYHNSEEFQAFKKSKQESMKEVEKAIQGMEENWDEEEGTKEEIWDTNRNPGFSYVSIAMQRLQSRPNLYFPSNLTRSERKEYREVHRRAFKEYLESTAGAKGRKNGTQFVTQPYNPGSNESEAAPESVGLEPPPSSFTPVDFGQDRVNKVAARRAASSVSGTDSSVYPLSNIASSSERTFSALSEASSRTVTGYSSPGASSSSRQ